MLPGPFMPRWALVILEGGRAEDVGGKRANFSQDVNVLCDFFMVLLIANNVNIKLVE